MAGGYFGAKTLGVLHDESVIFIIYRNALRKLLHESCSDILILTLIRQDAKTMKYSLGISIDHKGWL